jgi:hypothetical protein
VVTGAGEAVGVSSSAVCMVSLDVFDEGCEWPTQAAKAS